jgi:hypothetical protein
VGTYWAVDVAVVARGEVLVALPDSQLNEPKSLPVVHSAPWRD